MSLPFTFDVLLNDDLYTTYLGTYQNKKVVIKVFTEVSDQNNEYEVLEYLQEHRDGVSRTAFPQPYLKISFSEEMYDELPESFWELPSNHENIYQIIVYEYMEGETLGEIIKRLKSINKLEQYLHLDVLRMVEDISEVLKELHRLGLTYGDLHLDNILRRFDGSFTLIDYGRTFGTTFLRDVFPLIEYMKEDMIPEPWQDFFELGRIRQMLSC